MQEMRLAENLRTLRQGSNLKQAELAEKLWVNANTISEWELGACEPTLFDATVIADYFGLTLDELCFGKFE